MTPADLSRTVLRSVRRAVEEGGLRAAVPERVQVERSRPGGRGDYATNVAMRLARDAGVPALQIAETLRKGLAQSPGIAAVEITGPGFLNITLDATAQYGLARDVLEQGSRFGYGDALAGQVRPLDRPAEIHPAEIRAAVVAQVVGRILRSQGADVRYVRVEGAPLVAVDPDWAALGVETDGQALDMVPPMALPPAEYPTSGARPVPAGVPARELLRRFGPDAARWAMLRPVAHDRPRFDDDLLAQRASNPLFRIRYAHARACALTRGADHLGFTRAYGDMGGGGDRGAGGPAPSAALLAALGSYPGVLATAARREAPDRLARHLEVTADAFLAFQHTVLPLGDEKPSVAHRSRLALAEAAGTVLAGGLSLLGISAPEHL
ncbi:ArgS-related anticodon-binding protein NrtL [Streptomyces hypolithicus]